MSGREEHGLERGRPIVYCLLPRELAEKLHESLRRHFAEDPDIEVVVERRTQGRRRLAERRQVDATPGEGRERRLILAREGRRVDDRRAPLVPIDPPSLPRRVQPCAGHLTFVERLEPSTLELEDADSARLVTRFQAGERDVFGPIYLRYFDRLYGYLLVALRSTHEAEDAAQQIFTRVLEALPRYERRGQPFRAWLFRIARNHVLDLHAREGRIEHRDPDELLRECEDGYESSEELEALDWISDRELMMFIERLPLPQRQVLFLRFTLGLKGTEVAAVLDRTPADVRMMQARALRFLRERLERVGRGPRRHARRSRMRVCTRPAQVLRSRRFALKG